MNDKVFLDTAFAIALSVKTDENHLRAVELSEQLETNQTRLLTTRAILLEIGNALSKRRNRPAAVELLDALEHDSQVEIISLSDELYQQAFDLFSKRPDKDWGLIDCLSFVVMRTRFNRSLNHRRTFRASGFSLFAENALIRVC